MFTSRQIGADWERIAESFLNRRGLRTVQRNYQIRSGEIDLVMHDGDVLVFTEVRYRKSDSHGSGVASVSRAKQKRIINAAQHFLQRNDPHRLLSCRFDIISIGVEDGRTVMDWIPDAFDAN